MASTSELSRWVDELCRMVGGLGQYVELDEDMEQTAKAEFGMYMMYLSASDGKIAAQEAKTISAVCGVEFTTSEVKEYIEEGEIYSEAFESMVPDSVRLAVAADKTFLASGDLKRDELLSDALIGLYQEVGEALIKSDGNVSQNEVRDYNIYINMLKRYQKENLG